MNCGNYPNVDAVHHSLIYIFFHRRSNIGTSASMSSFVNGSANVKWLILLGGGGDGQSMDSESYVPFLLKRIKRAGLGERWPLQHVNWESGLELTYLFMVLNYLYSSCPGIWHLQAGSACPWGETQDCRVCGCWSCWLSGFCLCL